MIPRRLAGVLRAACGLAAVLLLAQCTWFAAPEAPPPPSAALDHVPDYWRDVRPVLDRRCVACHACYDAPCQLNLTAAEGVERGASKDVVYDSTRLSEDPPTRLFVDATSTSAWRKRGFYDVLNEGDGAGALARMLALKRQHPQPAVLPLPESFDFSLARAQQCPANDQFDRFARRYPLWGMPYGLPGIGVAEDAVLTGWIEAGAPARPPDPPAAAFVDRVARVEAFLNGGTPKERLVGRFLYEHLFIGDLYFDDLPDRQFFRLVRSRTPPGQPVEVIATRRPFDDPGAAPFWYRLQPVQATIVAKTHMPYALNDARLARWRQLFLGPAYDVPQVPGYDPEVAGNPFVTFEALPLEARYRFLLDDAGYFIDGFVKGPVCRGQVALNSIEDRFWVVFLDPDSPLSDHSAELLAQQSGNLRMPDNSGAGPLGRLAWRRYRDGQLAYLQAKQAFLREHAAGDRHPTLDLVWAGDGHNGNAGLTIIRHFDNASVVRGLLGAPPKTAWVMGYPLLERIHYLLVAGYDVFGTLGHQLNTRLYMDFMRMEGEFNFIALLPRADRDRVRDYWYRDADESVREYVHGSRISVDAETGIPFRTGDPRVELMEMFRARLAPVLARDQGAESEPDAALRAPLERLAALRGRPATLLPEDSVLTVVDAPGRAVAPSAVYTLLRDTGHTNVASLFGEEKRLVPEEDAITVARGIVGAYPNAFWRVRRADLPAFVAAAASLATEADYRAFVDRYGVSRVSTDFWAYSDQVLEAYAQLLPREWGVLDYSRLENR